METETPNLWNKRTADWTTKDVVVMNFALPAIMVGSLVAVGVAFTTVEKVRSKFRKTEATTPVNDSEEN